MKDLKEPAQINRRVGKREMSDLDRNRKVDELIDKCKVRAARKRDVRGSQPCEIDFNWPVADWV